MAEKHITGMCELLDALETVIRATPKAEREALASAIEDYSRNFPNDYYEFLWAMGVKSPKLLYHLINAIKAAAADDGQKRGRITSAA